MIKLDEFKSECEPQQKVVVCQDKGKCKYIIRNSNSKQVAKYTVDGNIIKKGIKCDFLFLNKNDLDAYYIEIKGSDIEHAIDQIEQTEKTLAHSLKDFRSFFRIVYKSGTHDIKSSRVLNWIKKSGKRDGRYVAVVKHEKYEEEI